MKGIQNTPGPIYTIDTDVSWEITENNGTFSRIVLSKDNFTFIFECDRNSECYSLFIDLFWKHTFKELNEFFNEISGEKVTSLKVFDNVLSFKAKYKNENKWPWKYFADKDIETLKSLSEGKRKYYILL
jgi:hypothetical protein